MNRHQKRGSIYIAVLGASMLVVLIGITALAAMRVQNWASSSSNDFAEARLYARSAVEVGMFYISSDPNWRTTRGNGAWATNKAVGKGTFSLQATDPIDNDVTNGNNHPVILTGTGQKGQAVCKLQARLEVGPASNSGLAVSMISGGNTTITSCTVTGDQTITANGNMNAGGGSLVNANVEAHGNIQGGTYAKATTILRSGRVLPDSGHVLDYYVANGTAISYTSLPLWGQTELLTNTSFETGTAPWYVYSGSNAPKLSQDNTQRLGGTYSLRVRNRKATDDVAAEDIPPASLLNGNSYFIDLPIRLSSAGTAQATLVLQSTGSGTQTFSTPAQTVVANTWTHVQGTVVATWTGTLTQATVFVTLNNTADYYMDMVTMYDVTYPSTSYVIDRKLIGPASNPFGSTNAQGIYVLNCGGKDIYIGNSRLAGTLVLLNAGSGTTIQGPVVWEAAVANYPALLTDSAITIAFGAAPLSESTLNMNFNPASTPFPYLGGTSNATATDTYPSSIRGLVYSKAGLNFSNAPSVSGVVIANNAITVASSALNLSYGNTYMTNPPPGFGSGMTTMQVVPGTWCRVVN